ncbi:SCF ubiquitin ligase complex subunit HRT3 [Mycosarcoma maydis]|uniref:F-box protein Hrt3/FBXO9 C-terminal domain-containing protein n=1 Tax=Mycosarcoma maydis TaxID=5270 RepID=A0A0D1CJG5_MYCMD|nr:SCF ubiquitin ligase complex subunit HRT3 [Ustilago maydis 521]KIS67033.1 hypothetical protein UMAG_04906 [Ustilago maydis 521]|eukprot:XP_011391229.1 hypothetical protein UMAG_04906 [Ustilago maydis 521]
MDRRITVPSIHNRNRGMEQIVAEDESMQVVDSASSTPLTGQSGVQTPALGPSQMPVNDELEQFRSEWKREVEARGHPTYAHPPPASSSDQSKHDAQASMQVQGSSSKMTNDAQIGLSSLSISADPNAKSVESDQDIQGEQDGSTLPQNDSLPAFPEAEIYAPAALKYSKGAHKMPRTNPSHTQIDLSAPIIPREYHPPPLDPSSSPSTSASSGSVANGVSHALRDRDRTGGHPTTSVFASTSIPPANDAQASGSSSESSLPPPPSRAPRIMATPDAPALASQATQAGMRSAVEAYAHAVEMERSGQLDQALTSYRRAFKLNSNADRLYHRAHLLLTHPALTNTSAQQNDALLSSPAIAEKVRKALDFDDHRYVAIKERRAKDAEARARGEPVHAPPSKSAQDTEEPANEATKLPATRPDELARLLDTWSIEGGGERDFGLVAFEPDDEEKQMPIASLPDEILLHILQLVIAPRGRRGAKVVKLKPSPEEQAALDAAAPALAGRFNVQGDPTKSETQKSGKSNASANVGANSTSGVKAGPDSTIVLSDKEVSASTATPEASSRGEKAATEGSGTGIVPTTRKQPLGIGVVLGGSDWQSLEIVGRTCWKLRLLTKSPSLWREIVRETYYPPILDPSLSLTTLYERNHCDWRTAFINQPRVRLNGCYIAACHYARPGLSEDAWVRVIHVVEFYRSIRFLPDGTALSLLTTDPPSETVRRLEPALKAKGFAKGRWELFEQGLDDDEDEGRPRGPKVVVEDLRDRSMHKYAFRMVFSLRSTTRGRWNKLDLLDYYSVNLTNGEVLPLPQKHSRPFHFSRVIAYGI